MCIRVSSDQAVDEISCVLPTSENGRPVWSRVYLCGLHLMGLNRTEYGCLCGFPVWKVKRCTVNSLTAVSVNYSIFLLRLGHFVNFVSFLFYFVC